MFQRRSCRALLPVLLFGLIAGCDSSAPDSSKAESAKPAAASAEMVQTANEGAADAPTAPKDNKAVSAPLPRKIVYTATVELNTNTFAQTVTRLQSAVHSSGGYIAETNVGGAAGSVRTGTWKVRIPVDRFDAFMSGLSSLGEVANTTTTSQDVSEEYYDVAARIKNKQAEEQRLLRLLQSATGKLDEILTVEKEISRVREEIERMEGRIRFLANQSDLTTITITVHELPALKPVNNAPSFATELQRTLIGSLVALADVAKALLLGLVAMLPWLLVSAGILWPLWQAARKRRRQEDARLAALTEQRRQEFMERKGDAI